jgi:hypothetical protein
VIVQALALLILPALAIIAGGWVMTQLAGVESSRGAPYALGGYDADRLDAFWSVGDRTDSERKFLRYDLVYPLYYGAIALAALLWGLALLHWWWVWPGWAVALVLVVVIADWTENTILLRELHRYVSAGKAKSALQPRAIAVANVATRVKVAALGAIAVAIVVLCVAMSLAPRPVA